MKFKKKKCFKIAKVDNVLNICKKLESIYIYIYIKPRHLFTKKLYFGFFQTFEDSIK